YMDGWSAFWSILLFGILSLFAIWLVIQLIKFLIIKNTKTPLEIAQERYAKGEITKDELEEIKGNLE
ncbi:MAG: SHOCT domain-containing protein, partial [Dehalococcoidales bacterium]